MLCGIVSCQEWHAGKSYKVFILGSTAGCIPVLNLPLLLLLLLLLLSLHHHHHHHCCADPEDVAPSMFHYLSNWMFDAGTISLDTFVRQ